MYEVVLAEKVLVPTKRAPSEGLGGGVGIAHGKVLPPVGDRLRQWVPSIITGSRGSLTSTVGVRSGGQ